MVGSGRIVIEYDDHYPHAIVMVAGQFTHWEHVELGLLSGTKYAAVFDGVEPGQLYAYKFIIDGHWTLQNGFPTEDDGNGNTNHVIIAEPTPSTGAGAHSATGQAQTSAPSTSGSHGNEPSSKSIETVPPTGNVDPNASFGAPHIPDSSLTGAAGSSALGAKSPNSSGAEKTGDSFHDAISDVGGARPAGQHPLAPLAAESVLDPSRVRSSSQSDLFSEALSDHYSEANEDNDLGVPEYPVSPRPTAVDASSTPAVIAAPVTTPATTSAPVTAPVTAPTAAPAIAVPVAPVPVETREAPVRAPSPPTPTERVPVDFVPKKEYNPIDINTGFPTDSRKIGEAESASQSNRSSAIGGPTLRDSKRSSLPPTSPPVNSTQSRNAAVLAAAARAPGAAKQEFASLGPKGTSAGGAKAAESSPEARALAKQYSEAEAAVRKEQKQSILQTEAESQEASAVMPKAEAQAATDIQLASAGEGKGRMRRFFKKLIN